MESKRPEVSKLGDKAWTAIKGFAQDKVDESLRSVHTGNVSGYILIMYPYYKMVGSLSLFSAIAVDFSSF